MAILSKGSKTDNFKPHNSLKLSFMNIQGLRSNFVEYESFLESSFFTCTARLWNSVPIECFPLTYDLNVFKSRINRHLLTVGSF